MHNFSGALGLVAVIIGSIVILLFEWHWIGPVITLTISGYMFWHLYNSLGKVLRILMPDKLAREITTDQVMSLVIASWHDSRR
ncbi:MAG: hypothetical protein HRT36_04685 [Alphaproteobacteria bacterium]|nr:hypothetical protein [Alphaproteobacteria bacterium]